MAIKVIECHFLISNNLIDLVKNVSINKKPRSKTKPSDHTPIELAMAEGQNVPEDAA